MASERPSASALSIVELAITILEDEDCLNAGASDLPRASKLENEANIVDLNHPLPGYGSNLTFEGTVECDAALMDGHTGDFGSVGAVPGASFVAPVARGSG